MKKATTFITFFIFSVSLFSQDMDYRAYIYIEDNAGRRDTAIIGYNDEFSTMDIDSSFGEEDIFGAPYDSLDIRSIRRDSINFNCFREYYLNPAAPNIYFSNNVDTKIDIRPYWGAGDIYHESFEILINGYDYPISVNIENESFFSPLYLSGVFYLLDADCNILDVTDIVDFGLFTNDNNSPHTLFFKYEPTVNTNEIIGQQYSWTLFPNPAYDKLEIESKLSFDGQFELINFNGQIIKSFDAVTDTKNISIDIGDINKGVYLIRYINKNGDKTLAKKFVKL